MPGLSHSSPSWCLGELEITVGLPYLLRWFSGKKNCLPMQETRVRSLGQEDTLEKEMATYSINFAWEIPWTEEPRWGAVYGVAKRTGCDLATEQQHFFCI